MRVDASSRIPPLQFKPLSKYISHRYQAPNTLLPSISVYTAVCVCVAHRTQSVQNSAWRQHPRLGAFFVRASVGVRRRSHTSLSVGGGQTCETGADSSELRRLPSACAARCTLLVARPCNGAESTVDLAHYRRCCYCLVQVVATQLSQYTHTRTHIRHASDVQHSTYRCKCVCICICVCTYVCMCICVRMCRMFF